MKGHQDIIIKNNRRIAVTFSVLFFTIIITANFLFPGNRQLNLDIITSLLNLSLLLYIRHQTGREKFRKNTFLTVAMYYTILKSGITIFYFSSAKDTFSIENINDYTPVFIFLTLFIYLLREKTK